MSEVVTCPNCGARNRVPPDAAGVPRCGRCGHALPWVTSADDATFERVVDKATLPVLVDLWAPWCGPCRIVDPGVVKAASTYAGRLKAVKVNVDVAPRVAERFNARSIPMLVIVEHGLKRSERVGAVGPDDLSRWVAASLASQPRSGDPPRPGAPARGP
jgi:thioredoxin 2